MYQISRFYHKVHKINAKQLWLWVQSPLWDWKFFSFLSFSPLLFPSFLTLTALRVYSGEFASVGKVLRVYRAGLVTIDFDQKHSSGRILGLW